MTKFYKLLFMSMLIMSTMISISAYSWMSMWMGLEINLMSIIPIMKEKNNISSSESSIKYFITQAIASSMIMFSMIMMMWKMNFSVSMNPDSNMIMILNSSLLMKMGMAPFHFWFPEVIEGLNWFNCTLILTWQKIAPMILLMMNMKFSMFMSMIIMFSMIISGIFSMNQISMRKILVYSSINHMGWMISLMMFMKTIWMTYFLIYSLLTINVSFILNMNKIFMINQLFLSLNKSPQTKLFFMLNFLSLSGIPPFLGFLPKWLSIQTLLENNYMILPFIMIMFTMIMIFVYIRIALSSFILMINESNWKLNFKTNKKSFLMSSLNFSMILGLIFFTLTVNI